MRPPRRIVNVSIRVECAACSMRTRRAPPKRTQPRRTRRSSDKVPGRDAVARCRRRFFEQRPVQETVTVSPPWRSITRRASTRTRRRARSRCPVSVARPAATE